MSLPVEPSEQYRSATGLKLSTPRLELRLAMLRADAEQLTTAACRGVFDPAVNPLWDPRIAPTQPSGQAQLEEKLGESQRTWGGDNPWLPFVVARRDSGKAIGFFELRARDFAETGEVRTTSWIDVTNQRQGFQTEARVAALQLAFGNWNAVFAGCGVYPDNKPSLASVIKAGYQEMDRGPDPRGRQQVNLKLVAQTWFERSRPSVEIEGWNECASFLTPRR